MTHVSTTWIKNILVTLLDVGIHEARDLAQNLQTDVFAQRYALVVVHAAIGPALLKSKKKLKASRNGYVSIS